ncbi:MAG: hypothetical protein HFJ72_03240 [Adlercreutzia sp.]|uniref:DUF6273 domain-containing protein n=1 Tax=uncultured Adlercreutzia sp. TaxID=875803 RepID=UPI00216F2CA2|nr:DUF6273 domain-containing protein [uncultured Adlercreutzia sp.]MCI8424667.1 hypothetical protein [Adlercreutzia sp.]
MRGTVKKAGVALAAGALVVSLAGCATQTAPVSDPAKGDNTLLAYTGANSADEQTFEKVSFGSYPQSGATPEAISWLKLAEQDGKTLLISEYVLDAVPYSDLDVGYGWSTTSPRPTTDVNWADSSMRAWLNDEFLKTAFTADEQGAIATVTNENPKSNVPHTAANGADASIHDAGTTDDAVFLLSVAEAKQYFSNDAARLAHPTEYALSQGVYTGTSSAADQPEGAAVWWLRSNGYYGGYESVVTDDGYVHGAGYRVNGELHDGFEDHGAEASALGGNVGVRPCIWVETSALS